MVVLAAGAVNALVSRGLLAGWPSSAGVVTLMCFVCLCFCCLMNPAQFLSLSNCRIDCGLPLWVTSAMGRWLLGSLPGKQVRIAVPTVVLSLV